MKQAMNPDAYGLDKYTRCPVCNEMGWALRRGVISHFARRPTKKVSIWGVPYIQQESVLIRECALSPFPRDPLGTGIPVERKEGTGKEEGGE